MLASSVGKPLKLETTRIENINFLKPVREATTCVEISMLNSRPNLILGSPDALSTFLSRVQIQYLTVFKACDMCHQLFYDR